MLSCPEVLPCDDSGDPIIVELKSLKELHSATVSEWSCVSVPAATESLSWMWRLGKCSAGKTLVELFMVASICNQSHSYSEMGDGDR